MSGSISLQLEATGRALAAASERAARSMRDLGILLRYQHERELETLRYSLATLNPELEPICVTGSDGMTRVRVRRLG